MDRLIPEGVELRDQEGKPITEFRLRLILGAEQRMSKQGAANAPVIDKAGHWGPVRNVHTIGNIQIAEVDRSKKGDGTWYCVFVDGKDTNEAAETLDLALVTALCHKYDGLNTRAHRYIAKMLGMEPKETKTDA